MTALSIDHAIQMAEKFASNGNITTAMGLYKKVLNAFPDNEQAKKGIVKLAEIKNAEPIDPSKQTFERLFGLFQQGHMQELVEQSNVLIKKFPKSFNLWNLLGAANTNLNCLENAEFNFQKACALNPLSPAAFNSLGIVLKLGGKIEESLEAYRKAISIKPDFAEAYNNMAIALDTHGLVDDAVKAYEHALALNPNYSEAYSNLAGLYGARGQNNKAFETYKALLEIEPNNYQALNNMASLLIDLGDLEEAERIFEKTLAVKPDCFHTIGNLTRLLALKGNTKKAYKLAVDAAEYPTESLEKHMPMINLRHNTSTFDDQIDIYQRAQADLNEVAAELLRIDLADDQKLIDCFSQCEAILAAYGINGTTENTQIFTGKAGMLDCRRYKLVFDNFNIIPKFCFDCYKVQIQTDTVINLLKMLIFFWKVELPNNNSAKCMIESRPNIKGTYKGFVFCGSLQEAEDITAILPDAADIFSSKIAIKRGCSEYALEHPKYAEINFDGEQAFKYDPSWETSENFINQNYPTRKQLTPECFDAYRRNLTIKDVLIFRNWLKYANKIDDQTGLNFNRLIKI